MTRRHPPSTATERQRNPARSAALRGSWEPVRRFGWQHRTRTCFGHAGRSHGPTPSARQSHCLRPPLPYSREKKSRSVPTHEGLSLPGERQRRATCPRLRRLLHCFTLGSPSASGAHGDRVLPREARGGRLQERASAPWNNFVCELGQQRPAHARCSVSRAFPSSGCEQKASVNTGHRPRGVGKLHKWESRATAVPSCAGTPAVPLQCPGRC